MKDHIIAFTVPKFGFFVLLVAVFLLGCNPPPRTIAKSDPTKMPSDEPRIEKEKSLGSATNLSTIKTSYTPIRGALLLTKFTSLEELKAVVQIEYFNNNPESKGTPFVRLTHASKGQEVISILKAGISETDMKQAWAGSFWDKAWLGLRAPYLVFNHRNLPRIFNLSRRRGHIFGEGDVAFYDLAEAMLYNISDDDLIFTTAEDISEKGYINSFNHITAQALITSIFSEKLADFLADAHERSSMPEMITGQFTTEQLTNWGKGAVDNYVDIINNEWGQELGKVLRKKYNIDQSTHWTPKLLADYLNDIQGYYSWAFQIGFKPFRTTDKLVIRFSEKVNIVMNDTTGLRAKKK